MCRHDGQAETIWSSALGQGHTSRAPALRPCWLAAHNSGFSFSLNQQSPIESGSLFSSHFRSQEQFCLFLEWFQGWSIHYVKQSPFSISITTVKRSSPVYPDFIFYFKKINLDFETRVSVLRCELSFTFCLVVVWLWTTFLATYVCSPRSTCTIVSFSNPNPKGSNLILW